MYNLSVAVMTASLWVLWGGWAVWVASAAAWQVYMTSGIVRTAARTRTVALAEPLHDVVHARLAPQPASFGPDVLYECGTAVLGFGLPIFLPGLLGVASVTTLLRNTWVLGLVMGAVWWVRPLCFCSTVLPDALPRELRDARTHDIPAWMWWRQPAHDCIFSAHAALVAAGVTTFLHAFWSSVPGVGVAALACACLLHHGYMLARRFHYTVDVIVSWLFTPLFTHVVFTHTLAHSPVTH